MDKVKESSELPDSTRRRISQAGLVAPVVLATLTSKSALGAAPYNCTISGKLSGNLSTHGGLATCAIGRSPGYWKHPDKHPWLNWTPNQKFHGSSAGGLTLPNTFYWAESNNKKIWVAPGTPAANKATLLQVLDASFVNGGSGNSAQPYAALARAVIASVLNSFVHGTAYAISGSQAISMYISVYNTGSYEVKPGVLWTAGCCTYYLESLYNLENGESKSGTAGCLGL